MQSQVLKDEFGLKTAPVKGALEARTDYRNKHVLPGDIGETGRLLEDRFHSLFN